MMLPKKPPKTKKVKMNVANFLTLERVNAILTSTGVFSFEVVDSSDYAIMPSFAMIFCTNENVTSNPRISIGTNDPDVNNIAADFEVVPAVQYVDLIHTVFLNGSTINIKCNTAAVADVFDISLYMFAFSVPI